jgi:hypothetical protein
MYDITPSVLGITVTSGAAGGLAVTGAGVGWYLTVAVLLIALGLMLVRLGHRRRALDA